MGSVCMSASCHRCDATWSRWMNGRCVIECVRQGYVVMLCFLLMMTHANSYSINVWGQSDDDSNISDITCWTCNDKKNNEECNNWAPDLKCPFNHTVCQTIHRFSAQGLVSIQVSKKCVPATDCTPNNVGCSSLDHLEQQECVSCCDVSYCNQEVPVNHSTALQLSSFTASQYGTSRAARTGQPTSNLHLAALVLFSIVTAVSLQQFVCVADELGVVLFASDIVSNGKISVVGNS